MNWPRRRKEIPSLFPDYEPSVTRLGGTGAMTFVNDGEGKISWRTNDGAWIEIDGVRHDHPSSGTLTKR